MHSSTIECQEVTATRYLGWDFGSHKPKEEKVTLVRMSRFQGSQRTIFPKKFPVPIVCDESCSKVNQCNLIHTQFDDLCKNHSKLGILVIRDHTPDTPELKKDMWIKPPSPSRLRDNSKFLGYYNPESVVDAIKERIRVSAWEYRAYKEDPFTPRRIYVGDDSLIRESELKHKRDEDNSFTAYSSQEVLKPGDVIEDDKELEHTMDTGMVSPEKSQEGEIPSLMYKTIYKDKRIMMGFDTRKVMRSYSAIERVWFMQNGKHALWRRRRKWLG